MNKREPKVQFFKNKNKKWCWHLRAAIRKRVDAKAIGVKR